MKSIATLLLLSMSLITFSQVEIQGHRGARGLLPENSIPAFLKAIELGVETIEMDVVISKDNKVVVSHDHHLNPKICLDPSGQPIENNKSYSLYEMEYSEIKKCDCGSLGNKSYSKQEKMRTYKPLLSEVIQVVEEHLSKSGASVKYNIELKASPAGDNKLHPVPDKFVELVQEVISAVPTGRIIIQSFDPRVLRSFKSMYPEYVLSFLISNNKPWQENIEELTFTPDIYSPWYQRVNPFLVRSLQSEGMKVIPWTINNSEHIQKCINLKVDGLITDYPDLAISILKSQSPSK